MHCDASRGGSAHCVRSRAPLALRSNLRRRPFAGELANIFDGLLYNWALMPGAAYAADAGCILGFGQRAPPTHSATHWRRIAPQPTSREWRSSKRYQMAVVDHPEMGWRWVRQPPERSLRASAIGAFKPMAALGIWRIGLRGARTMRRPLIGVAPSRQSARQRLQMMSPTSLCSSLHR